ncbi:MAG TPA: 3-phosphoserine/phosphohydroxythreonine transaminase [bacterium]|nr:3-phosphoserine/phosphohydroxythreonine transaminase [bacterium]HPG84676.1 3-phosphoserine/phosphohydroxythreonine transaminase [bacterium]
MGRIYNFNPGPSTLPLAALEKAQAEFTDYKGSGMSVLEISHRSKDFEAILADTQNLLKEMLGIPDNYSILFLGGGASLQFAMLAMNFIPAGGSAEYVVTGEWAKRALKEANIVAKGRVAASSEERNFSYLPRAESWDLDPAAAFVHVTSNNTIFGTQYRTFPALKDKFLICDMSSDILSHRIDVSQFAMIYAGAQKNLGPAGVTLVILRNDLAATAREGLPTMLSYATHIKNNSLYNTPPCFPIYIMQLTLQWVKEIGGLAAIEKINRDKAELLYSTIDESGGYYRGTVEPESRSWMNVTIRMVSEELEAAFIAEAKAQGLGGLKGHRSVGGIRASMYNAMPLAGIEKLTAFMKAFKASH